VLLKGLKANGEGQGKEKVTILGTRLLCKVCQNKHHQHPMTRHGRMTVCTLRYSWGSSAPVTDMRAKKHNTNVENKNEHPHSNHLGSRKNSTPRTADSSAKQSSRLQQHNETVSKPISVLHANLQPCVVVETSDPKKETRCASRPKEQDATDKRFILGNRWRGISRLHAHLSPAAQQRTDTWGC